MKITHQAVAGSRNILPVWTKVIKKNMPIFPYIWSQGSDFKAFVWLDFKQVIPFSLLEENSPAH